MIFVYVLVTVLLFYGTIDLLLRAVYAVLFSADKLTQYHAVFVSRCGSDAQNILFRIKLQRFFLPKGSPPILVDCGLDEKDRLLFERLCEENAVTFCCREEFLKLTDDGLQSTN